MSHRGAPRGRGGGGSYPLPTHSRGGSGGGGGRGGYRQPAEAQVFSSGAPVQKNASIENVENQKLALVSKVSDVKDAKDSPPLPHRPGYGTRGSQILLFANSFELLIKTGVRLFRYSINIQPEAKGKKAKRIVELLLEDHLGQYRGQIATDYKSNLVSKTELSQATSQFAVVYRSEGEDEPQENTQPYNVTVTQHGTLHTGELMNYLTSTSAAGMFGSKYEVIQALNIVLGHGPKAAAGIASLGANKHYNINNPPDFHDLGGGLTALRGFFVSVRAATARILVNVQVKNGAFFPQGRLSELIRAFQSRTGVDINRLARFLAKLRIDVTHIKKNNKAGKRIPRIKTIAGLATPHDGKESDHPPQVTRHGAGPKDVKFYLEGSEASKAAPAKSAKKSKAAPQGPQSAGSYISVQDFFKTRYNIQTDSNMPVVNVGNRSNPSYLPVEVCDVLAGQPCSAKLTPPQTAEMIRFAVRNPAINARSIVAEGHSVLGLDGKAQSVLTAFNMTVPQQLIVVPGRVLGSPPVMYSNNVKANTRFGSWNMAPPIGKPGGGIKFSKGTTATRWTYLHISWQGRNGPFAHGGALNSTMQAFQQKLREMGVTVAPFMTGLPLVITPGNMEQKIDDAIGRFSRHTSRPEIVLVILPEASDPMYNCVKFACDVKYGISNVCVVEGKFAKQHNEQYYANVALKFNLKLKGRNQALEPTKLGIIAEGKTMVVGLDVTHPSPGSSSNAPSVAGIVASIDAHLAQWPADIRIQSIARQEMVSALEGMLTSRLRLWQATNRSLPQNVLVYRDGVSEGQYDLVLNNELPLLRKACQALYPATDTKQGLPRISIVVVGKRHNTRFYPTRQEDADRASNPPNGTVVDRGVTEAAHWDFYMQAHSAGLGTARPAHYFVILDEIFRSTAVNRREQHQNHADTLEDLTHNMCYMFGRATKAVSICPAAYYADLVCDRARRYLSSFYDASPGATPAESIVSGAAAGKDAEDKDVKIHDLVKDTMFYI